MPDFVTGHGQPGIDRDEHNSLASAKDVVVRAFDGSGYLDLTAFNHTAATGLAVQLINSPDGDPYGGPSPNATMFNLGVTTAPIEILAANANRTRTFIEVDGDQPDSVFVGTVTHASLADIGITIQVKGQLIDDGDGLWKGSWFGQGATNCTIRVHEWDSD